MFVLLQILGNNNSELCAKNEIYFEAGSCEGTCANPNPMCTGVKRPPGCYCPSPNFIRTDNLDCVSVTLCPRYHTHLEIEYGDRNENDSDKDSREL